MVAPGCDGCQVSSLPGSPRKRNNLSHETSFSHFRGAPAHIKSHCLLQQRTGFSDFTTLLLALPAAESSTSAATLKSNLSKPWSHPHTPPQVSLLQHLQLRLPPLFPAPTVVQPGSPTAFANSSTLFPESLIVQI